MARFRIAPACILAVVGILCSYSRADSTNRGGMIATDSGLLRFNPSPTTGLCECLYHISSPSKEQLQVTLVNIPDLGQISVYPSDPGNNSVYLAIQYYSPDSGTTFVTSGDSSTMLLTKPCDSKNDFRISWESIPGSMGDAEPGIIKDKAYASLPAGSTKWEGTAGKHAHFKTIVPGCEPGKKRRITVQSEYHGVGGEWWQFPDDMNVCMAQCYPQGLRVSYCTSGLTANFSTIFDDNTPILVYGTNDVTSLVAEPSKLTVRWDYVN